MKCQDMRLIFLSIGSGSYDGNSLDVGAELRIGGKEIEIDCKVSRNDYFSGACFGQTTPADPEIPAYSSPKPMIKASKKFSALNALNTTFKSPLLSKGIPLQPVNMATKFTNGAAEQHKEAAEQKQHSHWSAQW